VIGAANAPNKTTVPPSVESTLPVFGSTEKETPVAGPSPLPLIVMISPGAIAPAAPLAELVNDVITTLGTAALTVSETEIVCGLFAAPVALIVIAPW
jgi:hypothetical protein